MNKFTKIIVFPWMKLPWMMFLMSAGVFLNCGNDDSSPSAPLDSSDVGFTNLRVEDITAKRAVVLFTTSQPTTCFVEYGTAADSLDKVATDPSMGVDDFRVEHTVTLEDIIPATTYYYRGLVTTEYGDTFYSSVAQFTTLPDTVSITLTNIALLSMGTKVADVSSNFGNGDNDSAWGANKAIDGLMATEWSSSGDGDNAFITLDFGQVRTVASFGFRSRQMADGSSIITSVRLIFDGKEIAGPFETPNPDVTYVYELDPHINAKTVRVETLSSTGGNTGAKEIQFFSDIQD